MFSVPEARRMPCWTAIPRFPFRSRHARVQELGLPFRGMIASATILFLPAVAAAQSSADSARPPAPIGFEVFAGGELEGYLRALQNIGQAGDHPWSLRGFSVGEVRRLAGAEAAHPWQARYRFGPLTEGLSGSVSMNRTRGSAWEERVEFGLLRPRAATIYNSDFPFGGHDGPLWAGRGLTSALQFGGFARVGPVSLVVAPVAFHAQNKRFELAETGIDGDGMYRSPLTPRNIDLPQAFGSGSYGRLDAGYTTLRLDAAGISIGASTAAQQWGPSDRHPLVLGPNAGGFPHLFFGSQMPLNLGIGHVHARAFLGRLDQSSLSPYDAEDGRRLMTGLVVAFLPRGLPGLELGMTRFFHREWPEGGIGAEETLQPFESLLKNRIADADQRFPDNQVASVFARWNVAGAGAELFGEFVRIDHAFDSRVLLVEPDDLSGYALGIRRVWQASDERLTVFRAEIFSTISSHRERGGARQQLAFRGRPMYQHGSMIQGHTHRGQLLASPAGHGGAGSTVGIDRYHANGRWSMEWERRVERDGTVGRRGEDPADADVSYALSGSALRFSGPVDLEVRARGIYNLNRYLQDDAFNLNLSVGATLAF